MIVFNSRLATWVCALVLLGSPTHGAEGSTKPAEGSSKVPTNSTGVAKSPAESYRLRVGDVVELRVYQEEELTTRTKIDAEGNILLPLVGRVLIRGETVASATAAIRARLEADYFYEARTSVLLVEQASEHFLVLGQVARPGVFDIPSGEKIDLVKAITMAGGYTKIANPKRISVKRTSAGREVVLQLNGKNPSHDSKTPFQVQPDDQITVGESAF